MTRGSCRPPPSRPRARAPADRRCLPGVAWPQARVVAQTPDFVVVSKPAGVPAAPTVDNLLECAPGCAAQARAAAAWPMPGTCTAHFMAHAWHVHGTCTAHARRMHGTCMAHARHMHGTCTALLGCSVLLLLVQPLNQLAAGWTPAWGASCRLTTAGCHPLPDPLAPRAHHQQAVGHPVPLLVTHRLDQCTEGLLVLGKTKAFVAAFNELVKRSGGSAGPGLSSEPASRCSSGSGSSNGDDGRTGSSDLGGGGGSGGSAPRPLRKFYRAATAAPPPLGLLRHHLSIERRQAGLPCCTIAHDAAVEGSLPAELRVLEVQPIRRVLVVRATMFGGMGKRY